MTASGAVVKPESDRLVELIARAVALMALALPAAGALVRYLNFRLDGIPPQLAAARSLPELAVFGFEELWPAAVSASFFYLFARWGAERVSSARANEVRREVVSAELTAVRDALAKAVSVEELEAIKKRLESLEESVAVEAPPSNTVARRMWIAVDRHLPGTAQGMRRLEAATYLIIGLVLPVVWWIFIIGPFVASRLLVRAVRSGRADLSAVLPPVIALFVFGIVSAGITPLPARATYLYFDGPPGALINDWYDVVGAEDGFMFARRCQVGAEVVGIPMESIASQQYAHRPGERQRSVWLIDLARGEPMPPMGFTSGCSAVAPTVP